MKNTMAMSLVNAEQKCLHWESALHQFVGEMVVQEISQANVIIGVDEADTVRGQYITAIACIRMQDFCLSRKWEK